MHNLFFTTALAALLTAFTGNRTTTDRASDRIDTITSSINDKWKLVMIYSKTGNIDVTGKNSFIRFDSVKGSAAGKGGCNSFGSTLSISGSSMQITGLFSTKMYCQDVQPVENSFFSQLQTVTRYTIDGNKLLLYAQDELVLELEKE